MKQRQDPSKATPKASPGGQGSASASDYRNRRHESPRTYFRCDRYFTADHVWYVTNREGQDMGPYSTRSEAEFGLAMHIAHLCTELPEMRRALFDRGEKDISELEAQVREIVIFHDQRPARSANVSFVWVHQRLTWLEQNPNVLGHPAARSAILRRLLRDLDAEHI